MKYRHQFTAVVIFASLMALYGCQEKSGTTVSQVIPPVEGSGTYTLVDQPGGDGSFTYRQDLGASAQDVYFIFTNIGFSNIFTPSQVGSLGDVASSEQMEPVPTPKRLLSELQDVDISEYARQHGIGLKDLPAVIQFNADPPPLVDRAAQSGIQSAITGPLYADSIGDPINFMNESNTDLVAATLRHQIVADSRTLNLWVANDSWAPGTCTRTNCMTLSMLQDFGEKFLLSGTNNDIWDWIANIYGVPWGTHSYPSLISSSAANQIDILFFDIENDDSTDGGVLGFFWFKDNYLTSTYDFSNERLIFYIDSVMSATDEGGSWDITDKWPAEMVSTLAHEFQHMIQFYQKNVLRTGMSWSDTWLNEMASMAAEDLVADKLGINGPRGVAFNDGTAGSAGNTNGRLSRYNYYNDRSVTTWEGGSLVLASYAINYAFGAYLSRNFGGAELMQKIVQSNKRSTDAIDQAFSELGRSENFVSLLRKWGVAVLLSNLTNNDSGYRYNTGSFTTTNLGAISYNLGSINLYNYDYGSQSGPYIYTPSSLAAFGQHYATSNTYVRVGTNLTGAFETQVDMPAGVLLTVVTKDSQ